MSGGGVAGILLILLLVVALFIAASCVKIVPQASAYVVESLGKYKDTWATGLHFKVPFIERVAIRVNLKEQVVDFPPQPVITKDNVTMQIDTVVFFQVMDAKLYTYGVNAERMVSGAITGGMKQKLTIIGALVHQPPVWVLDEPMVGLDPRAAHILKEEMRKHCEKGNTVFFSTHVLEVAEKLCDEIAIIDKGRLVAQGTLEALRSGEKGASLEQLFLELTESEEKQA